jgi:coenzyme F420-0:L-glutamate ligase/coenzyme F420-1:gamma-L-glutamate ligase
MLCVTAVTGLPEIGAGFDLAAAIVAHLSAASEPLPLQHGDVLVIAHKAISKAEGRIRELRTVQPGPEAIALATAQGKDPRHVQVVLDEASAIVRAAGGVIITETRHGFVCANAGVDASNAPGDEIVIMLPVDPDASARRLRGRIRELTGVSPGIVVTDSFGRAWRTGQCDIAIGCAGLRPLEDWRGGRDARGHELRATVIAVADELAGAADLARRKDSQEPVVLVRGAGRHVTVEDGPGVAPLLRAREHDLFR